MFRTDTDAVACVSSRNREGCVVQSDAEPGHTAALLCDACEYETHASLTLKKHLIHAAAVSVWFVFVCSVILLLLSSGLHRSTDRGAGTAAEHSGIDAERVS